MNYKILFVFIISLYAHFLVKAQIGTPAEPVYKRIPSIPPFEIYTAPDSVLYKKDNLKNKKQTLVMVFSPDCDHCLRATEDMLAHFDKFKKIQIVMATPMAYTHALKFYNDYKLQNYSNIHVGTDAKYFLGTFFEVRSFPAIFLYDKKGNFKQTFESNTPFEKIAEAL